MIIDIIIISKSQRKHIEVINLIGYTGSLIDDFEGIGELSLTADERIFLKRILKLGQDGCEHGIMTLYGKQYEFTSGFEGAVQIPSELLDMIDNAPQSSVKLFHNHPNGTAPSDDDLDKLLIKGYDHVSTAVDSLFTAGANGNIYKVSIGENGDVPGIAEYKAFCYEVEYKLDRMFAAEIASGALDPVMANYLFAKEQAYEIIREYKWEYTGGRIDG
jgi:hypothetical protein